MIPTIGITSTLLTIAQPPREPRDACNARQTVWTVTTTTLFARPAGPDFIFLPIRKNVFYASLPTALTALIREEVQVEHPRLTIAKSASPIIDFGLIKLTLILYYSLAKNAKNIVLTVMLVENSVLSAKQAITYLDKSATHKSHSALKWSPTLTSAWFATMAIEWLMADVWDASVRLEVLYIAIKSAQIIINTGLVILMFKIGMHTTHLVEYFQMLKFQLLLIMNR